MNTYLVVRQADNSHEFYTYEQEATSKQELKEMFSDWDSDTPEITYKTLVIKKLSK